MKLPSSFFFFLVFLCEVFISLFFELISEGRLAGLGPHFVWTEGYQAIGEGPRLHVAANLKALKVDESFAGTQLRSAFLLGAFGMLLHNCLKL